MTTISALCVSGRSIYKHLPGVDCYDRHRDARQFNGRNPVVTHAPCRTWSKFLSHQAKPPDLKAEQDLAFFCLDKVLTNGGVFEHPAGSRFWEAAGLPLPNQPGETFLYSIYVEQAWFAFASRKPTWLLIAGLPRCALPPVPFSLAKDQTARHGSQFDRARTMASFARWLCQVARLTWWQHL